MPQRLAKLTFAAPMRLNFSTGFTQMAGASLPLAGVGMG